MGRSAVAALAALALGALAPGCGADEVQRTEKHTLRAELFAGGFGVPWGMAFLPDGRLLVSAREGGLYIVDSKGGISPPVEGVPAVRAEGQGGLMDVALHPLYAENGWIYLSYSDPLREGNGPQRSFTAVVRGRLEGGKLADLQTVYRAPDRFYSHASHHYGSRLVFDGDHFLFFSIGDRGAQHEAQRTDTPNGKVHRLHDDGRVPADNPFVDRPGALATIWSYGHRNPQGLALHPETGTLWDTEHGPRGGDELNWVRRAANYGWPTITYGINYDGTTITDLTHKEGMEQPAVHWTPSIAVCGIDFYEGDAFPAWRHNLLVTALAFEHVRRVEIRGEEVVHQEIIYRPGSRVRDVETGPDGYIYVALEDPGRIVRLVPAD